MNFYRCGSGGGHLEETVLWENPSPTSNFAAQVMTLSDDINNYDYLKFVYKNATTGSETASVIMSINDCKKSVNNALATRIVLGGRNSGNTGVSARNIVYASDTSLSITLAYQNNGTNSYADIIIPLQIMGIKEVGGTVPVPVPSDLEETTLWTNSDTSSAFAQQTVTLSESVENYDYIGVMYYYNTSYNTGDCISMNIASLNDIKKWRYSDSTRHNIGSIAIQDNANTAYSRNVFLVSNTEVRFGTAYQVGSGTVSNTTCMPYKVVGLKKAVPQMKYDTSAFVNVAGGNTVSFTTKGRAEAIWLHVGRQDAVTEQILTNVNPTTGVINNNDIYYQYITANAINPWASTSATFIVTDTSISTSTKLSSNARVACVSYSYK